jgi:predicted  nucleic acid-binding Zn-ribbon protein
MYKERSIMYADNSDSDGDSLRASYRINKPHSDFYTKEKIDSMKYHYEQRISQLSEVIQDTCMSICSDELLQSMKLDATSSAFVPAHISEILNVHIDAERERYIHSIVENVSNLEASNRSMSSKLDKQSKKITMLESDNYNGKQAEANIAAAEEKSQNLKDQFTELTEKRATETAELRSSINNLEREKDAITLESGHFQRELSSHKDEINRLRKTSDQYAIDVRNLETKLDQSHRDMSIIQSVDLQEQQIKHELKSQLQVIVEERDSLVAEMGDLQSKLRYTEVEVNRLQRVEHEQTIQLQESRNKQQQLMIQVEDMLQTEASESNAAMAAIHEKMKELRHKLFTEVTKEKRHSASLLEELTLLRAFKDEKTRELRSAIEEETNMREKLQRELNKSTELSRLLSEQSSITKEARIAASEADVQAREAIDKALMLERKLVNSDLRHKEELLVVEESIRMRSSKAHDIDNLELQSQAYRLHYQNQLIHTTAGSGNPMRHSYSGLPTQSQVQVVQATHDSSTLETALASAKSVWTNEKQQLDQKMTQYIMKSEKLQAELDMLHRQMQVQSASHEELISNNNRMHEREMNSASSQHEHEISLARSRIEEADRNIEKLKSMVINKKKNIDWLQQELLRAQSSLQGEIETEQDIRRKGTLDHRMEEAKYNELYARFKAMEGELEKVQTSESDAKKECLHLSDQMTNLRGQIIEHEAHNKSLEIQLNQSQRKVGDAVTHEIQDHALQHHKEVKLNADIDELNNKIKNLESNTILLRSQLTEARAGMSTLQVCLKDAQEEYRKVVASEGVSDTHTEQMNLMFDKIEGTISNHLEIEDAANSPGEKENFVTIQKLQVALTASLEETRAVKEAAMKDHEKDSAMLTAMQEKFQSLMSRFSTNPDSESLENKNKEIVHLREQLAAAALAVANNSHKSDDAASVQSQSSASSQGSGLFQGGGSAAKRALAYKDAQLEELRQELHSKENSLAEYKSKMVALTKQLENAKTDIKTSRKSGQAVVGSSVDTQRLREELQHRDIEHDRVVHLLQREVQTLQSQLSISNSKPTNLNAHTPDHSQKQGKRFSPGAEAGESIIWEQSQAHSKSSKKKTGSSSVYESITKAMLDALIRAHMITPALALEINNIAQNSQESSVFTSVSVQRLLDSALEQYKEEYQSALAGTITESEQLHVRVNELQLQLNKFNRDKNNSSQSHFDEAFSLDADSSRGGISHVELEQSRHEHNLLVELTKLEGDARTKMLLSQIKDLKKRHSIELERINTDKHEELNLQKSDYDTQISAMNEELRSLKQTISFQADSLSEASVTRTSTLDTKLQLEKNRRKDIVRQFEHIEEQHRVTIEELESAKLGLEQRCEKAELQVTKLRMDLVHAGGSRVTESSTPAPTTSTSDPPTGNGTSTENNERKTKSTTKNGKRGK